MQKYFPFVSIKLNGIHKKQSMNEDEMLKNDFTSILSIDLIGSNPEAHRFPFHSFACSLFVYLRNEFKWLHFGTCYRCQYPVEPNVKFQCRTKGFKDLKNCQKNLWVSFKLLLCFQFPHAVQYRSIAPWYWKTYTCVKSMPMSQDVFLFKDINFMYFCYSPSFCSA